MSERILVATRKGLFTVERGQGAVGAPWAIAKVDFLASNVSMVLADPRDGTLYAALDHGHFGAKMHRALARSIHQEARRHRLGANRPAGARRKA